MHETLSLLEPSFNDSVLVQEVRLTSAGPAPRSRT